MSKNLKIYVYFSKNYVKKARYQNTIWIHNKQAYLTRCEFGQVTQVYGQVTQVTHFASLA